MNVTEIKAQMHMQEWTKLIENRQNSGLSIKEWCGQNNLPESRYYYYLKKLRLAACEQLVGDGQNTAQFALVPKQARAASPSAVGAGSIRITLPGAVVEIGEGAREAQIRFTLEVLLNAQ